MSDGRQTKALGLTVVVSVLCHQLLSLHAFTFPFTPAGREQAFRQSLRHYNSRGCILARRHHSQSAAAVAHLHSSGTLNEDSGHGDANDEDLVSSSRVAGTGTLLNRRRTLLLPILVAAATAATKCTVPFSHYRNEGARGTSNPKNANKNINNYCSTILKSTNVYSVQTAATLTPTNSAATARTKMNFPPVKPSVHRLTTQRLLKDIQSKRAVFLGERHPDGRGHLLQAALIRNLYDRRCTEATRGSSRGDDGAATARPAMAVGLEAVQRQFQPALDAYVAGAMDEARLRAAVEWDTRWSWSFEAYRPVLQTCRDLGLPLLALDISTEDRTVVENGGWASLDAEAWAQYVPNPEAFREFGRTRAYQEYINYTLKPPYDYQSRMQTDSFSSSNNSSNNSNSNKRDISFSNFVARQMLRDEGMASVSSKWLVENPNGLLVGCIGINHATFGCGVPGRVAHKLSSVPSSRVMHEHGNESVTSILIDPEPLNTGTELKRCNKDGTLVAGDTHEEAGDRWRPVFVPNEKNQICLQNSVEWQNYALQLEYVSSRNNHTDEWLNEAAGAMQALPGENVLALSDYLLFPMRDV